MIMDERDTQTSKKPVVNQRREKERERQRDKERVREKRRDIVVLNERIVISLSHYIFHVLSVSQYLKCFIG